MIPFLVFISCMFGVFGAYLLATRGTVDKYVGDAIMAFWGAPLAHPQHALAACTTALVTSVSPG